MILSFLCHHVENTFTSGVYPYSNDWNSLKSSTKVKAIWIKCSQNMCCFRNKNLINLPFLLYNSDNFGFVMSVYHIIHHTKILSFYWSMQTFILEKKKLCDFFIRFVSLRSNGDNLAPICPFNTGFPVNENSIFYLFWWFGLSPSSFLISPHWLNVLRRCKCPQLAKKVADIPELVQYRKTVFFL